MNRNSKKLVIAVCSFIVAAICLTPFLWMIAVSFSKYPNFLASRGIPYILTFQHYMEVMTTKDLHVMDYLKNSLVVSIAVTLLAVIIASFAGYAVSRIKFKGKTAIILGILSVSMFPQISIVGYLFKLMTKLHWINTYQALIFPYVAWVLPLALWILISYFMQISTDLDEAAIMDGATRVQALVKIILPLSAPGIFSTSLLVFISAFNEFLFALMLTTDYHARTIPVGIALFEGLHGEIPWGQMMATSTIASVPLVILTLIFQRYIVQGLTAGALKE